VRMTKIPNNAPLVEGAIASNTLALSEKREPEQNEFKATLRLDMLRPESQAIAIRQYLGGGSRWAWRRRVWLLRHQ
jgi:hypothetical protein